MLWTCRICDSITDCPTCHLETHGIIAQTMTQVLEHLKPRHTRTDCP
jgi:hypothetical protein